MAEGVCRDGDHWRQEQEPAAGKPRPAPPCGRSVTRAWESRLPLQHELSGGSPRPGPRTTLCGSPPPRGGCGRRLRLKARALSVSEAAPGVHHQGSVRWVSRSSLPCTRQAADPGALPGLGSLPPQALQAARPPGRGFCALLSYEGGAANEGALRPLGTLGSSSKPRRALPEVPVGSEAHAELRVPSSVVPVSQGYW